MSAEDNTKDEEKFKTRDVDKNGITSDMLLEILEESIRIFWLFIKADKDASSSVHKGPRETLKLLDPADSEFLREIQAKLQKVTETSETRSSFLMWKGFCDVSSFANYFFVFSFMQKERRLNEFLKSRSSILKMFQKHEEDSRDNFLYFFPQVEIKLVWRVLNMSKITKDQLVWCHNKLNNISMVNRNIHIEPSFSLFPSIC